MLRNINAFRVELSLRDEKGNPRTGIYPRPYKIFEYGASPIDIARDGCEALDPETDEMRFFEPSEISAVSIEPLVRSVPTGRILI